MRGRTVWLRWAKFNGVGILGILVQLGVLAALVRLGHVHYLLATAAGVESAVLHNFAWHQRWTWRDRPAKGSVAILRRLWQFHAVNGLVSLIGNLVLMRIFCGYLGLDAVPANLLAVTVCSAANFLGSERLVFRAVNTTAAARTIVSVVCAAACLGGVPAHAGDLDTPLAPETVAAWKAYERQLDQRYAHPPGGGPFFAVDEFGALTNWRQSARSGNVVMLKVDAPVPGAASAPIAGGRIHHWLGAIFVPGVTLEELLRFLKEHAGRESESYSDVLSSKLLGRDGERLRIFMKLRRTNIVTVTYNTEHEVTYRRIQGGRAGGRSVSTRIAELADAGTEREHEKPIGADRGFLWRLNAYWRYEQVDGGVLVECESVSLSRDVPAILRPFMSGTVDRIARESLERTLVSLRATVTKNDARGVRRDALVHRRDDGGSLRDSVDPAKVVRYTRVHRAE